MVSWLVSCGLANLQGLNINSASLTMSYHTLMYFYPEFCDRFRATLSTESFPGGSDGKESACNAEDLGLIPGSRTSPREGNGSPLQSRESHGQRSLVGHSPWVCKELDMTEQLTVSVLSTEGF